MPWVGAAVGEGRGWRGFAVEVDHYEGVDGQAPVAFGDCPVGQNDGGKMNAGSGLLTTAG